MLKIWFAEFFFRCVKKEARNWKIWRRRRRRRQRKWISEEILFRSPSPTISVLCVCFQLNNICSLGALQWWPELKNRRSISSGVATNLEKLNISISMSTRRRKPSVDTMIQFKWYRHVFQEENIFSDVIVSNLFVLISFLFLYLIWPGGLCGS